MGNRTNTVNTPAFKIVLNKVKSRPNISLPMLANEMRGYVSQRTGKPISTASLQAYLSTARNLPEVTGDATTTQA